MRRSALLVLPALIAGSVVAVAGPAAAYTPSVKPQSRTIAAGDDDTVFIGADGKAYGMGRNEFGQLTGSGQRTIPQPLTGLPSGVRATAVSAQATNTLVLGSNGKVYGAGVNVYGQLTGGSGLTPNKITLTALSGLPSGVRAKAIALGGRFSIVLGSNGTVYGTGDNSHGELTAASPSIKTSLTALTGLPSGVKATDVAAGLDFTVVLGSDHRVYGTGASEDGELSTVVSTQTTLKPFHDMPAGLRFTAVAAGEANTVVLGSDHRAYAFGDNASSEFGTGAGASQNPDATQLPVEDVVAVTSGRFNIGLLTSSGAAYGAGFNISMSLTGAATQVSAFHVLRLKTGTPSTAKIVEFELGSTASLVRDADGVVLGAGPNSNASDATYTGQLTGPTLSPYPSLTALHGQKIISYARPSISGTRQVGHRLTAHVGSFSVKPTRYVYTWLRNGSPISPAKGSTYQLTNGDKGKHISVKITGHRRGFTAGSATSTSTRGI